MLNILADISINLIKETFYLLSESLIGQKNYGMLFLKALFSINESTYRIENSLSKLVREPFLTAIDQFNIGCKLEGNSKKEKEYREERFRNSLNNFDRALSLAQPNEKSFINLMRGFCALNLPGGSKEALIHFEVFQKECEKKASELKHLSDKMLEDAKEYELKANEVKVDDLPKGLGGGTFFSMSIGESKMEKATLLMTAREKKEKADNLLKESNEYLMVSSNLKAIVEAI